MTPDEIRTGCETRFLRYVRIDTRADETSPSSPSTPGQLALQRELVADLQAVGVDDVELDENGYVMGTIPATSNKEKVPTIGFIAHVDTSPEVSGTNVQPIVHRAFDGRDLVLPDDPASVLRVADSPYLAEQIGYDIITASGSTLLGADDKAGVAEIVTAAEVLLSRTDLPHGRIRLAFTPDEEIGRGTKHFDVAKFGAVCAYTMDGGARGELEIESFSADAMEITFHGFNTHPGYAKDRMVNAIKVAARFIARLPDDRLSPETTAAREGFVHPYTVKAAVDQTTVRLIVRDFVTERLAEKEAFVESLARMAAAEVPGADVTVKVEEQYRNMREVLDAVPQVAENAREALRRAGLEPRSRLIRGGTDGSRLSFMGLPTPNLFAGEQNFHSRLEWVSTYDMQKAVETIVHLCQVWHDGS